MDIGLEIRLLRERRGLSARELAAKLGISPSQISRLESGQRRIDMRVLDRIAGILEVNPAVFFQEEARTAEAGPLAGRSLGQLLRIERHKRHLSADEVAKKIGRPRAFLLAIESGEVEDVDGETAKALARALRLDPMVFLESQREIVSRLRDQVDHLTRVAASRDHVREVATGEGRTLQAIPILGAVGAGYPVEFGAGDLPLAPVTGHVVVPDLDPNGAFALRVVGDRLEQSAVPSFRDGELVVLADQPVLNRDFAFVRLAKAPPVLAQVYYDAGQVRFQPLNRAYPPDLRPRDQVLRLWKVVAHLTRP